MKDRLFWLAIAAGPIVWLLIFLINGNSLGTEAPLSVVTLLLAVVAYPCLEEIVFRGALQGWLLSIEKMARSVLPGLTFANVLTSIVFSLFHLINQSLFWAVLVFFPSLIFGWARDRYGNLMAPIVLHGFYNAGFFLLVR